MTSSWRAVGGILNRARRLRWILPAAALTLAASPLPADLMTGWQAYQRGDFATAIAEWTPLAESGDAQAQYNLGVTYSQVECPCEPETGRP